MIAAVLRAVTYVAAGVNIARHYLFIGPSQDTHQLAGGMNAGFAEGEQKGCVG